MVIKDLQKIKKLADEKQDENWRFRSWLKFNAPGDIDAIVKKLSLKYSAVIDCKECANCCRSLEIVMEKGDLSRLANASGISKAEFEMKHSRNDEDGDCLLKPPCPMLKDKLCSIYSDRPNTCRTYPHLEKTDFLSRLIGVIGSLSVCPIAFNAFEELKIKLRWTKNTDA